MLTYMGTFLAAGAGAERAASARAAGGRGRGGARGGAALRSVRAPAAPRAAAAAGAPGGPLPLRCRVCGRRARLRVQPLRVGHSIARAPAGCDVISFVTSAQVLHALGMTLGELPRAASQRQPGKCMAGQTEVVTTKAKSHSMHLPHKCMEDYGFCFYCCTLWTGA